MVWSLVKTENSEEVKFEEVKFGEAKWQHNFGK